MNENASGKELILFARSISPSLGKKERRVTHFISNNYQELAQSTIGEVASHLQVSTATITKVCKKLKCQGFLQLKKAIQSYIANDDYSGEDEDINADFDSEDSNEVILEKVMLNAILAIQDTLGIVDHKAFDQAATIFRNKQPNQKIILVGSGGSGILCEDFQHKLLKIGIFAHVYKDTLMQVMFTSLINSGDIVLGISHSGRTKNILRIMEMATSRGAHTISLTNYMNSPITEFASVNLVSTAKNTPITGENAAARIVQLSILDALYTSLVLKNTGASYQNLMATSESVKDYR
ncbi:MurR/RpiR family transcriptional regulator [Shouchella clausii]|jgi:RpiR family transcriptional regulator, repressor of rpiB and als operon|nr:SIS domain-containing protein [Shouchella clausii]SPU17891.1 RpiR transcriptional regulator [Niallia circulans]MBU8595760.1 SIS domain-containing protein [Shouchella clausii]MCY1103652.1 SIS domain-containing protein [Shouchella clausii]MEB5478845.1 SIS domain-containing protein [Shouchella clausii]MED4159196.1 SIS domain-containing protein [Shouchella clausii]